MKHKILFMDDEENILCALQRMLNNYKSDWDCLYIDSIHEARKIIESDSIDIAVLDIRMQDGDGLRFLKEIKQNSQTEAIDVIMLTGMSETEYKREALDLGAADLLSKPIQHEELIARLNSVLKLRHNIYELKNKNHQLEEQLVESQKMELIALLAAGAVHDLNGLLSVISGYSSLMLENTEATDEFQEDLSTVVQAVTRASGITNQILAFTRNREMKEEEVDLNIIISECTNLIRQSIPKRISLQWQPFDSSCMVHAIPIQLYQLMMNLIFNARNAIEKSGSIQISLDIVDRIHEINKNDWEIKSGPYYKIVVSDTGKGMSKESIKHIFQPLYSTNQKDGGTGLGLSVVRMIVQKYQGRIYVDSEPGQGTIFYIYLPST